MVIKVKLFDSMCDFEKIANGDWIDLRSRIEIEGHAGQYYEIPLGVAMELPEGYEAHVIPRSSSFKKYGFIQTNSIGLIDNTYCGDTDEWKLPVLFMKAVKIHKGERVCQFRIVENMKPVIFQKVTKLSGKNRNGLGSTGRA